MGCENLEQFFRVGPKNICGSLAQSPGELWSCNHLASYGVAKWVKIVAQCGF